MPFGGNQCAGCADARRMILPAAWATCKGDRLCDRFDTSLLHLLGRRTVGEYERVHQLVTEGQARARTWFTSQPFPESAEEFLDALRELHGAIFEEAVPRIAGRFRVGDEEVTFGGGGAHALTGAPCHEIAARLRSLHALLVRPCAADRAAVAGRCAHFLEVFFRVHPFLDGNGRVGRFVILWYCEANTERHAMTRAARVIAVEVSEDIARFTLPEGVDRCLQALLDRQDRGEPSPTTSAPRPRGWSSSPTCSRSSSTARRERRAPPRSYPIGGSAARRRASSGGVAWPRASRASCARARREPARSMNAWGSRWRKGSISSAPVTKDSMAPAVSLTPTCAKPSDA